MAKISGSAVAKHNTKASCWIVVHLKVYDVTSFLSEHPGGATVLLKQGGADATAEFDQTHSIDILNDLPSRCYLGELDRRTIGALNTPAPSKPTKPSPSVEGKIPDLSLCLSADDFEAPAKAVASHQAWTYISSSANSGLTLRNNLRDWSLIHFRPRVLVPVAQVDTRRAMHGHVAAYPFYFTTMGALGQGHPDGEPAAVRGAVHRGIHFVASTAASRTLEDIMQSYTDEQARLGGGGGNASPSNMFFQLYCPADRERARALIRRVRKAGYKALWWTVDTPVLGNRLADRRLQAAEALEAELAGVKEEASPPQDDLLPRADRQAQSGFVDADHTWGHLKWMREEWGDGPIVIKGIQCWEDAKLAADHGCSGIVLSNHGGRQLHSAPSALRTLLEIRTYCPEIFGKMEVYVDGGLRNGADILKAICLGATAVGVGRPFFYALASYGTRGVERCADILAEDLATGMRLLGITSLDQARPELVNTSQLLNEMWRSGTQMPRMRSLL